ncbi:hypothetical protein C808_01310 [Lachnospiraceae bacterium M18-1]|nr:hypothetical protein C808_01310 [Lachnospiraceae bacterium M18-1]
MADYILNNLHGMTFPGWEPERMAKLGLPRLLCDKKSIGRFLEMVDDDHNCLCSGSLGAVGIC